MSRNVSCSICGAAKHANATCKDGHYVCDICHSKMGYQQITETILASDSRNPIGIATRAMHAPFVNMHGPEHHYLVTASLLAAYKNAGKALDMDKALTTAQERCGQVPGGICGLWGCCGAAIGAGIFVSIITGATPLSDREWQLANMLTSQCLQSIAQNGGVRCCKRDVFLAILQSAAFLRECLDAEVEIPSAVKCSFFQKSDSCKKELCLFYPKRADTV